MDGTKILREEWNKNTMIPLYDNEDSVCGIIYNNTPYYFQKNLQGDIIAIVNKEAETIARYSYDAWGVCSIDEDASGVNIARINPFRYRGYYFDEEIGLYYLQSRYYNPFVGRFLNGDEINYLGISGEILGYNFFTYCNNDSVNNIDYHGNFVAQIVSALIGAMIGAASYLVGFLIEKYILKRKVSFDWWLFSASILIGVVDGVLSSTQKIGKLLNFVVVFLVDFIPSIVGGDSVYEALICAFLVAIVSMCLSGNGLNPKTITKYNKQLINKLKKNKWKIIKQGIKTFFKK